MAKKFASIARIEAKYKKAARDALLNKIRPRVKEALQKNIDDTVYSNPESDWYVRSYAMRTSVEGYITADNDMETVMSIFPDPKKMVGFYIQDYAKYGSIASPNRNDNRDMIVEWLNEGTSGSPIYNHKGHHFMDKTFDETNKIVKEELAKAFKKVNNQK